MEENKQDNTPPADPNPLPGHLVHVFAGHHGGCVWREDNETLEAWIARASKLSEHGDVWITPHWC